MNRNIGKPMNYSIPKAALIYFYEKWEAIDDDEIFVYMGNLDFAHGTVDVAGGKHVGPDTGKEVVSRLRSSPYWDIVGEMDLPGRPICLRPSKKGKEYYSQKLKE